MQPDKEDDKPEPLVPKEFYQFVSTLGTQKPGGMDPSGATDLRAMAERFPAAKHCEHSAVVQHNGSNAAEWKDIPGRVDLATKGLRAPETERVHGAE